MQRRERCWSSRAGDRGCGKSPPAQQLTIDDRVAVSTFHDQWEVLPGLARDISVGDNGAVWVVGDGAGPDFVLHKWTLQRAIGTGIAISVRAFDLQWTRTGNPG
jgi:hypothetical protein